MKKQEQDTVELIHAAFDDAEDFLLRESEKFEGENKLLEGELEHARTMKRLGFENATVVKEAYEKKELLEKNKQLTDLVRHYKENYPFLKFLTEIQLEDICEKYDLIHAPVENYKENVPKKNLKEIAGAKRLAMDDRLEDEVRVVRTPGTRETTTTQMGGLFIAGPESHFNLDGLKKKKGIRGYFQEIIKTEVDDPIVFRYVRGGIQVLSKWGLEADDPMLANPLDN